MSTEEPAWKAELYAELARVASGIESRNCIEGGIDYGRRDLEYTVFEAILAAEQRGREAAAADIRAEVAARPIGDMMRIFFRGAANVAAKESP